MPSPLPAGPRSRGLLDLVRWVRSPLPMLDAYAARYGSVFTMQIPRLPGPAVFFAEPAAIRDLWTGDPLALNAGEANAILRSVLGEHSLLVLDGERHLRERRLMLPPFHGERMRAYGAAMRDATLRELATWPVGRPFPIHAAMQAITLDVIMRTIFGVSDAAQLAPLRDALVRWTTLATSPFGTAMFLLTPPDRFARVQQLAATGLGRLLPWAPIVAAGTDTDRLVRQVIAERRRTGTAGRDDVLSMLIDARDEHGQPMSDDELRDEMLTLLLAGHETTATTLAWTLHHLLANPAWLARIRAEAAEVDDPDRLVLVDAAVKETLRLTPILPMVGRRIAKPMTIGGHDLPVGSYAIGCIYLMHRRPDLWPDPTTFDPGRFLGKKIDPTHYFPFGGGARRCLGMAFATHEMKIVLSTILARVELVAAPGPAVRLVRRGITFAPSSGMPVVVTRRATAHGGV